MMGRLKRAQGQLFYSFCLDDAVPDVHLFAKSLRYSISPGCMPSSRHIIQRSADLRLIRC
jgi:hypothetical protein